MLARTGERNLKEKCFPGGAIWINVSVSTHAVFAGARVSTEQVLSLPALITECLCS